MRDDLMVQEQINNKWEHMVGVIMLNQTHRKQVKAILPEFLQRFPDPDSVVRSRIIDIEEIIKPLGMYKVRAKRIYRMTVDYLRLALNQHVSCARFFCPTIFNT